MKTVWISETNHHEVLLNLALDFLKTYWSFEERPQAIDTIFYPRIRPLEVSAKFSATPPPFFPAHATLVRYNYRSVVIIIIIIVFFEGKKKNISYNEVSYHYKTLCLKIDLFTNVVLKRCVSIFGKRYPTLPKLYFVSFLSGSIQLRGWTSILTDFEKIERSCFSSRLKMSTGYDMKCHL